MERDGLIQKFCQMVNAGLANQQDHSATAYETLKSQIADDQDKLLELLSELQENFTLAYAPKDFYTQRILQTGISLDMCYDLLAHILDPEVLDTKEAFEYMLTTDDDPQTFIMIGRFWAVSGNQLYDADGRLVQFHYDPFVITHAVAAVCCGDYMHLNDQLGMGAIGQAVSREGLRGGGHGKAVTEAFEDELRAIAKQSQQTLKLIALESMSEARNFWAKRGYRWVEGSHYFQPAMSFDEETGEPDYPPIPELLMLKLVDAPEATHIDRDVLIEAVRTLYDYWYLPDYLSEHIKPRVQEYVFGQLFEQFATSLSNKPQIALVLPPTP